MVDWLKVGAFSADFPQLGSCSRSLPRNASTSGCERPQQHFGLSGAELARLHGPAGIYIGSQLPAAIHVSFPSRHAARVEIATP